MGLKHDVTSTFINGHVLFKYISKSAIENMMLFSKKIINSIQKQSPGSVL